MLHWVVISVSAFSDQVGAEPDGHRQTPDAGVHRRRGRAHSRAIRRERYDAATGGRTRPELPADDGRRRAVRAQAVARGGAACDPRPAERGAGAPREAGTFPLTGAASPPPDHRWRRQPDRLNYQSRWYETLRPAADLCAGYAVGRDAAAFIYAAAEPGYAARHARRRTGGLHPSGCRARAEVGPGPCRLDSRLPALHPLFSAPRAGGAA